MKIQTMSIYEYDLVRTCFACPEQYEVYDKNNNKVGYLRLRHGEFRADYPECGGKTVYESYPQGDGIFEEYERMFELKKAIEAIHAQLVIDNRI
jgi:hypothetical protein